MTDLFRRAVEEAAELPPSMQDAIAAFILAELDSDDLWDDVMGEGSSLMETWAERSEMEEGLREVM